MHKFFVEPEQIGEATICLTGENCHHVRHVLRLKKGQEILIKDGQGTDYYCIIEESGDAEIICRIEDIQRSFVELPVSVSLFQGLPKQEKMEWIIQKCVELGVSDIYPVAMKRSVSKIDAKTAAKKTERWNKIAESAAKQSGRDIVPVVHQPISFRQALMAAAKYQDFFVPHEAAEGIAATRQALGAVKKAAQVGCMIGPEGGFSPEETQSLMQLANQRMVTLGKRILRTETAGMVFLAMLSIMIEEDMEWQQR